MGGWGKANDVSGRVKRAVPLQDKHKANKGAPAMGSKKSGAPSRTPRGNARADKKEEKSYLKNYARKFGGK